MRRKKLKRRSKALLLKLILLCMLIVAVIGGVYFIFPNFFKSNLISPLAQIVFVSDRRLVEQALLKNKILYSSIKTASDSSYLITLSAGGDAIITSKKNINLQISSLQLMLNRLTIEGKRIKSVDFRYDRPVVRL
ncbi:MAG: hypothetical protein AAB675_04765 [Patescibacteria group bacterium]